jgi:hypothetical protein
VIAPSAAVCSWRSRTRGRGESCGSCDCKRKRRAPLRARSRQRTVSGSSTRAASVIASPNSVRVEEVRTSNQASNQGSVARPWPRLQAAGAPARRRSRPRRIPVRRPMRGRQPSDQTAHGYQHERRQPEQRHHPTRRPTAGQLARSLGDRLGAQYRSLLGSGLRDCSAIAPAGCQDHRRTASLGIRHGSRGSGSHGENSVQASTAQFQRRAEQEVTCELPYERGPGQAPRGRLDSQQRQRGAVARQV